MNAAKKPPVLGAAITVLHVIPSLALSDGGPTFALFSLVRATVSLGVQVTVVTTAIDPAADQRIVERHIDPEQVKVLIFRRQIEAYKISFGLRRWLKRHVLEFDIVHVHAVFSFSSSMAASSARKRAVPYIVRPLGVLNRWGMQNRRAFAKRLSYFFVEKRLLRNAAALHFTSSAEANESYAVDGGLALVRHLILPLIVEIPSGPVDASAFRNEFPALRGLPYVLFLSRLDQKKGIERLLEAFATVLARVPNARLVIAGDGKQGYVEQLKKRADHHGVSEKVLWAGFLNGERKAAAFAGAQAFVLPSHSENFGIAAAEALSYGAPLVITEEVGIAEYVRDQNAGVIVGSDPSELATAVADLLRDPVRAERYAERGRRLVEKRFSKESVGAALLDLYAELLTVKH